MQRNIHTDTIRTLMAKNRDAIQDFCYDTHPHSISNSLESSFSPEETWTFLSYADIELQANIFEYFSLDYQLELIECTGQQHMARLIEQMSSDDRATLLRHLPQVVSQNMLRLVDEANRKDIASLVRHQPDTAGGRMTSDYAWLPMGLTAGEAIELLRLQAPKTETIHHVYVLTADRTIKGTVALESLVVANVKEQVSEIMTDVVTVRYDDELPIVVLRITNYDLSVLPVVDDNNCLIGIITHDDILDVIQSEHTEDSYRQAAIGSITENYLRANPITVWRKRVGWLACLFIAEMFTFTALASFEHSIEKVVVLSLFIPLCISTGGNSGAQAATLIIRAMAIGHVRVTDWLRVLWHELLMGIALGLSLGAIGFLRAAVTPKSLLKDQTEWWQLSLAVASSVTLICLWGTVVGAILPIIFKRLGFDPAFASSPFVATFVDVTGIIIYFTVAAMLIPVLGK